MFQKSVIALIQKRTSVRTYDKTPIEEGKRDAVTAFLCKNTDNPFGAAVRFKIIDGGSTPEKLGTYGFIRGAQTFVAGCVKKGEHDIEGFGYVFEKAVLYAEELGLGTCWLGGTYKKSAFLRAMQPKDEFLPAVLSVGYAAGKRSIVERAVAASAGARKRKSFGELFFEQKTGVPLDERDTDIKTCLEMVRIGPSASNKQPWRVIRKDGRYHFYLKTNKNYTGNNMFGFCMQRIDLGIAACHFELSAKELGVKGQIAFDAPQLLSDDDVRSGYSYSFTWA